MAQILPPGAAAPGFNLHVTPDQMLSLSDLADQVVILAFYPADWSPVCGDQMTLYSEILPEFHDRGAEFLGSRSIATGAMRHSQRTVTCISRCFPILNRKAPSQSNMAPIAKAKGFANGLCSSSTSKGRFSGAIARPSRSIQAPTGFLKHLKG